MREGLFAREPGKSKFGVRVMGDFVSEFLFRKGIGAFGKS
jgi:hypothetical protein